MSLYRQLWLSVLLSMLLALAASLFALLHNGSHYLEKQLGIKNRDNAAALALALGQQGADRDSLVVAVTAQFNSGQYEYIQVTDPYGRSVVEHIAPASEPEVPRWFTRLLPLRPAPGVAQISDGWRQAGTIVLASQSRFAYRDLWQGALSLCGVMTLAGLLGGVLGSLVLRRLRRPMQAVIEQANAITERRFTTIAVPRVPELRQLATAMNGMVTRLHREFEEDAARFEALRRAANYDTLTGLANRDFFLGNLAKTLADEEAAGGILAIVRIARLDLMNHHFGREATDNLLVRISQTLGAMGAECPGILAARLKGGDFALMLTAECDARSILDALLERLTEHTHPYAEGAATVFIGHAAFVSGEAQSSLLSRIDQAVAAAESTGHDAVQAAAPCCDTPTPANTEDWRLAIQHALGHPGHLKLVHQPIFVSGGTQCECHLRLRLAGQDEWLPANRFMPQAERLGLAPALDLAAVTLVLDQLEAAHGDSAHWVRLSARSIADSQFRDRLLELLMTRQIAPRRLWLEVPEIGAIRHLDGLRELARALKPLGCRLGLGHYGHQFNRIGVLYDLGLDFLKVDAAFIRDIDRSPGNQAFLAGLRDTAHKIGMQVFAEGVATQEELAQLARLDLDGHSGPVLAEAAA
ncbi:MAG: EAL domain-containing protein [Pseudomonadota bacterium]